MGFEGHAVQPVNANAPLRLAATDAQITGAQTLVARQQFLIGLAPARGLASERPKLQGLNIPSGTMLAQVRGTQRPGSGRGQRDVAYRFFYGQFNGRDAHAKASELADYIANYGDVDKAIRSYQWIYRNMRGSGNPTKFVAAEFAAVVSAGSGNSEAASRELFSYFWQQMSGADLRAEARAAKIAALVATAGIPNHVFKSEYRSEYNNRPGSSDSIKFAASMDALRGLTRGRLPAYPGARADEDPGRGTGRPGDGTGRPGDGTGRPGG